LLAHFDDSLDETPDSLYEYYIALLRKLGITDARIQTEKILALDYIIANQDRHLKYFGVYGTLPH
jgi:hypothetical protein